MYHPKSIQSGLAMPRRRGYVAVWVIVLVIELAEMYRDAADGWCYVMYRFGVALLPARADTRDVMSNVAHLRIPTCTCRCCTPATQYPCSISNVYKAHIMHGYLTRNVDLPCRPHLPGTTPQSPASREVHLQSARCNTHQQPFC